MRLLLLSASLLLLLLLGSCATTATLPTVQVTASRVDTMLTAYSLPAQVDKLVIRGNVIVQQGTGNSVTGKDKTGQRAQALSTGANSPVTASAKRASVPWWVFALVAVVGAGVWEYISHQLTPLGWLRWRAPTSG